MSVNVKKEMEKQGYVDRKTFAEAFGRSPKSDLQSFARNQGIMTLDAAQTGKKKTLYFRKKDITKILKRIEKEKEREENVQAMVLARAERKAEAEINNSVMSDDTAQKLKNSELFQQAASVKKVKSPVQITTVLTSIQGKYGKFMAYVVSGDTAAIKDELKRLGFRWYGPQRSWWISKRNFTEQKRQALINMGIAEGHVSSQPSQISSLIKAVHACTENIMLISEVVKKQQKVIDDFREYLEGPALSEIRAAKEIEEV